MRRESERGNGGGEDARGFRERLKRLTPLWWHRCHRSGSNGVMAITLRLTDQQDALLTRLAAEDGISKQEATVRAIESEAERRLQGALVEELSEKARDRWADVLRRLGE